jgi:hypothetical protein
MLFAARMDTRKERGSSPRVRQDITERRNERRKLQRKSHNSLVSALDALLPPSAKRCVKPKQGAGVRGLGTSGRSLHQVPCMKEREDMRGNMIAKLMGRRVPDACVWLMPDLLRADDTPFDRFSSTPWRTSESFDNLPRKQRRQKRKARSQTQTRTRQSMAPQGRPRARRRRWPESLQTARQTSRPLRLLRSNRMSFRQSQATTSKLPSTCQSPRSR